MQAPSPLAGQDMQSGHPPEDMEIQVPTISHRMYSIISFRKSTPPQNRQLSILISNSGQYMSSREGMPPSVLMTDV